MAGTRLPAQGTSAAMTQPPIEARIAALTPSAMWRCLVIEDELENARYIADGLRAQGHVAIIAHEAGDALRRACGGAWRDKTPCAQHTPPQQDTIELIAVSAIPQSARGRFLSYF